jgi:EmrB/QacA subfamily drug resistance transporter
MAASSAATAAPAWGGPSSSSVDKTRWLALVILSASLFIVVLDSTILNVAVPTFIGDLKTDISGVQWVISGYALIFASLLITFGRLGDVYGRRRLFLIGLGFFGVGSLGASLARSAPQLFVGEALLEGIGAAMMIPSTLSIISATFQGRERGAAFAVWGSVAGGAGALGPWVGGILTSDYSWRWAFRVNVVVAPLAFLAALAVVRESRDDRASGVDPLGVAVVTVGLASLVFGIIEASRYGWWKAVGAYAIAGLSVVPFALALAATLLAAFVVLEQRRVAASRPVVFDFGDLVHRGFRYGLINTVVLAMGEFGAFFILPLFLQAGLGLSAIRAGTWLLPAGIAAFFGGGIGGALSRQFGPKYVITIGLALEAVGIWLYVATFSPHTTFLALLPALLLHGIGIGFATSQLTNVVLSDVPPAKAGSASGAASMVRQVGTALGIALIGAIFATQAAAHISRNVERVPGLPPAVRKQIVDGARSGERRNAANDRGASNPQVASAVREGIASAARPAVGFAGIVVTLGALLSLAVPNIPPDHHGAR